MHVLIYASACNLIGRNLHREIMAMNAGVHSTCCSSLEELDNYLRQPMGVSPVGILVPSDDAELAALIGMRHLLRDMRLILILPESHSASISNTSAHTLRPRFICYTDGNLGDVIAVLCKMKAADACHPLQAAR